MLIHKTMKMPTSCLSCWIAPTCEVWVREKSKYKGYDNRLENCPLEEVKHGRWIIRDIPGTEWYRITCSECGEEVTSSAPCIGFLPDARVLWDYCPYCGAKMDEVEDETD